MLRSIRFYYDHPTYSDSAAVFLYCLCMSSEQSAAHPRSVRAFAAVIVSGSILLTQAPHESRASESNHASAATEFRPACAADIPGSVAAAKSLLARTSVPAEILPGSREDQRYRNRTAKRLGVITVNTTPASDKLLDEIHDKSVTTEEARRDANKVLKPLGVKIILGPKRHNGYVYSARSLTKKEVNGFRPKAAIRASLDAFDDLPRDFLALGGLKNIVIVSGTEYGGYVLPHSPDPTIEGNMYIAIKPKVTNGPTLTPSPLTIRHELFHMADSSFPVCGYNFRDDPTFEKLNGKAKIYHGDIIDNVTPNYANFVVETELLRDQQLGAEVAQDSKLYCKIKKILDKKGKLVKTSSPYHPEASEDKAEKGQEIFDPFSYDVSLSNRFPTLKKKFLRLFARLHVATPRATEYMAAISSRPSVPSAMDKSCA